MNIAPHTVVSVTYRLTLNDAKGEFVEETTEHDPLVFLCGVGQMLPDFESQLMGKTMLDTFAFGIDSDHAYGPFHEEAIIALDRETFAGNEDMLEIGAAIPMRDPDGELLRGTVLGLEDNAVIMDFNHPMAGKNLYFTGTILEVRVATADELAHGHVHGEGGVHH